MEELSVLIRKSCLGSREIEMPLPHGKTKIQGVIGVPVVADVFSLNIRMSNANDNQGDNRTYVSTLFAVVDDKDLGTKYDVILPEATVRELQDTYSRSVKVFGVEVPESNDSKLVPLSDDAVSYTHLTL